MNEFAFGSDLWITIIDGTTRHFLPRAILVIFVRHYAVSVHERDSGEGIGVSGVGVGIKEQTQAGEIVDRAKDRSWFGSILGEPQSHAISGNVRGVTGDIEFKDDLEIVGSQGETRPEPTSLGSSILGETDVLVGVDDGVGTEIPELVLQVRVDVGGVDAVRAKRNDGVRVHLAHLDVFG